MSGEHFTLTISQSTSDAGDFAIHMKEPDKSEQLLVHLRFTPLAMFDEAYLDDLVGVMARKLAKRIIEWRVAPDDPDAMLACQSEARAVVQEALERMKKNSG
ncbi:hypothetical protein [Endozoicomonas sp. SCSIO W0465]|uniref:hypothetical protein n=1 Tax=Endozoicomonas sp. SCSIO W0465 TaxID=2918516 RepID=UPI002074AF47|nr:hypothetical protein [Endozoicomonas sp. SCSIO W0465]USE35250.1 hypothetical protein MJO57_24595 [Endozoicomonas sp. SCSIO W0465]